MRSCSSMRPMPYSASAAKSATRTTAMRQYRGQLPLLQRIEEYEGVIILASNLRKNMDEHLSGAFMQTIEFPFPDARRSLANMEKGVWPMKTPRQDPIWSCVASRFELT